MAQVCFIAYKVWIMKNSTIAILSSIVLVSSGYQIGALVTKHKMTRKADELSKVLDEALARRSHKFNK